MLHRPYLHVPDGPGDHVLSSVHSGNRRNRFLHAARVPRIKAACRRGPETPVSGLYGWESCVVSMGNEVGWVVSPGCSVIPGDHPGIGVVWVFFGYFVGYWIWVLPNPFWFHSSHTGVHAHRYRSYGVCLVYPVSLRGGFPETGVRMVSPSGIIWVSHEPTG